MKTKCEECGGKCCVGIIEVTPEDELYSDLSLTEEWPGAGKVRRMRTKSSGVCVAQDSDGRCGIYARRSSVCRRFEMGGKCCDSFFTGKVVVHVCEPCLMEEG